MVGVISEHSFVSRLGFLQSIGISLIDTYLFRCVQDAVNNSLIGFSYECPSLNVVSVVDVNHTACFRLVSLKSVISIVNGVGHKPDAIIEFKLLTNGLFSGGSNTV